MTATDGTLVTGRTSHEVYVVEDGRRRWVPDAWTMHERGLSPDAVVILDEATLDEIPQGAALPSAVPAPRLDDDTVVESDAGVFRMAGGQLHRVLDPRELALSPGFDRDAVVYLPAALIRSLFAGNGQA